MYDLTIIGGGSAGLVLAVAGAKLGKKTALVEKHRIGGDCLWTGCVPSKALLKAAKVANYIRNAEKYGIGVQGNAPDWQGVMDYVRGTQHVIEAAHDNPERFREMGVDVIFGDGHFEASDTFVVADAESGEARRLESKKFVISTGSRPATPPIPGLEACDYLDSETVWELEAFPERLLVIGAGPIGIELGQAFHRLGADVTIAQRSGRILTKEDTDVSEHILHYLREEGITVRLNTNVVGVNESQDGINVTFSRLQTAPNSPSRLQTVPTNSSRLQTAPTSPSRLQTAPNSPSRLQTVPTNSSRLQTAPTSPSRLQTAPNSPSRLQTVPTNSSRLQTAPNSPSRLQTAPNSPSRLQTAPNSNSENGTTEQAFDKILIAAGRVPNIEGLGLDKIGVQVGGRGIEVNDRLQTSVRNIYAAGDVIGHYLFTHVAAFQAQLLLRNIFFPFSNTINYGVVPWTTFCDPEVARCGLTEAEAREKYGDVDVFTLDQHDVDRAVAEGETYGFSKVIATRWTGKILGVHLVGANAGEVVHEYVLAMQQGIPLRKLSGMMHVYPTFSSSVWRVAGKWFSESTLIQTLRKLMP